MVEEPFAFVENVSYTHWNQETPTLKEISLAIMPGTINVLVGPGGSGKSTLCSLFNGEIPHLLGGKLEGHVRIDGLDTRESAVKDLAEKAGHMLQDPETMFATLYTEDEIAFGPENLCLEKGEISARVERLLEEMQLLPQRLNLVWNLSGGQIQKLGLATILAMRPRMVILDEPTANLDPIATRQVHELILSLRDQGITILLVQRELDDFILSIADQLLVLKEGRLVSAGPVQSVLAEQGNNLDAMGIWLPETVEISLEVEKRIGRKLPVIPIGVQDTLQMLREGGLLPSELRMNASETISDNRQEQPLVAGRELKFTYPNGFNALKGVSFEIYPGEMLAIVGRNGAGKSTLSRLLTGLLKPQMGELSLFGRPAGAWKVDRLAEHIALVFQNPEHQFLTDTTYDEIAYSLQARGVNDQASIQEQVEAWMERLQLTPFAKTHPFALSAGMKRRLGVATMLVCRPKVLLVDEPTYGQDKEMTRTLMAIMEEIRGQGVSVVMITHDMRLVQEYAERVIVMADGQILFTGDPADLFVSEEILRSANLRPTLLQELLAAYEASAGRVCCPVRNPQDFMQALDFSKQASAHGSQ
jgi:energy-coupling factor transporter ATP-binding protein EcfA2